MRLGALLSAFLLLAPNVASARPSARLRFDRPEGAAACGDEASLRAKVSERLGYDPFRADADAEVHTAFRSGATGLGALVELRDGKGALLGHRELSSDDSTCADLVDSVVLAVSIVLDAISLHSATKREAVDTSPPPPASVPPSESQILVRAAAFGLVGVGVAPAPSFGIALSFGVQSGPWSLDLEARADLPASAPVGLGTVQSDVRMAELVPCGHWGVGFLCVVAGLGSISIDGGDVPNARHTSSLHSTLGARLGAEIHVLGPFYGRAFGEIAAPLVRTTAVVGDTETWTTPDLAVLGGFGLLGRFR